MTCTNLPLAIIEICGEVIWSNNGAVPISIAGDMNSGKVGSGQAYTLIFDETARTHAI